MTNPEIARSDKWGSRKRLATLRALAQRPLLVDAVRTVVVTATEPLEIDWFAVLAADASEASLDALMPHAARALEGDVALLELLRAVLDKLPGSDGLSRLREGLSRSWTQKLAASGVDTLATELGVPPQAAALQGVARGAGRRLADAFLGAVDRRWEGREGGRRYAGRGTGGSGRRVGAEDQLAERPLTR